MSAEAKKTAAEKSYYATRFRISYQVGQLEAALVSHEIRQLPEGPSWGAVGDLNHVSDLLGELLGFINSGSRGR